MIFHHLKLCVHYVVIISMLCMNTQAVWAGTGFSRPSIDDEPVGRFAVVAHEQDQEGDYVVVDLDDPEGGDDGQAYAAAAPAPGYQAAAEQQGVLIRPREDALVLRQDAAYLEFQRQFQAYLAEQNIHYRLSELELARLAERVSAMFCFNRHPDLGLFSITREQRRAMVPPPMYPERHLAMKVIAPPPPDQVQDHQVDNTSHFVKYLDWGFRKVVDSSMKWPWRILQVATTAAGTYFGAVSLLQVTSAETFDFLGIPLDGVGEILGLSVTLAALCTAIPKQYWDMFTRVRNFFSFGKSSFQYGDSKQGYPRFYEIQRGEKLVYGLNVLGALLALTVPEYVLIHEAMSGNIDAYTAFLAIGLGITLFDAYFKSGIRFTQDVFRNNLHWGPPVHRMCRSLMLRRVYELQKWVDKSDALTNNLFAFLFAKQQEMDQTNHGDHLRVQDILGAIYSEFQHFPEGTRPRKYQMQEQLIRSFDAVQGEIVSSTRLAARDLQRSLSDTPSILRSLQIAINDELNGQAAPLRERRVQEKVFAELNASVNLQVAVLQKRAIGNAGYHLQQLRAPLLGELQASHHRKRQVQKAILKEVSAAVLQKARDDYGERIVSRIYNQHYRELTPEELMGIINMHLDGDPAREVPAGEGDVHEQIAFLFDIYSGIQEAKTSEQRRYEQDEFQNPDLLRGHQPGDYRKVLIENEQLIAFVNQHIMSLGDSFEQIDGRRKILRIIRDAKTSPYPLMGGQIPTAAFTHHECLEPYDERYGYEGKIIPARRLMELINTYIDAHQATGMLPFHMREILLGMLKKVKAAKVEPFTCKNNAGDEVQIDPAGFAHDWILEEQEKQYISLLALWLKRAKGNKTVDTSIFHTDRPVEPPLPGEGVGFQVPFGPPQDEAAPLLAEEDGGDDREMAQLGVDDDIDDDFLGPIVTQAGQQEPRIAAIQMRLREVMHEREEVFGQLEDARSMVQVLQGELGDAQEENTTRLYDLNAVGSTPSKWQRFCGHFVTGLMWASTGVKICLYTVGISEFLEALGWDSTSSHVTAGIIATTISIARRFQEFKSVEKWLLNFPKFFSRRGDLWGLHRGATVLSNLQGALVALIEVVLSRQLLGELFDAMDKADINPSFIWGIRIVAWTLVGINGVRDLGFFGQFYDDQAQKTLMDMRAGFSVSNDSTTRRKRAWVHYYCNKWKELLERFDDDTAINAYFHWNIKD